MRHGLHALAEMLHIVHTFDEEKDHIQGAKDMSNTT